MKKFIVKTLFYIVPFICSIIIYITLQPYITGDIGRLGQIPFGKEYNKRLEQNYLTEKYFLDTVVSTNNNLVFDSKPDILVIGDSFSNGKEEGYQNYLTYLFHYKVVNITRTENISDPIQSAISLLNSGIIDSNSCKIIIVQSVDRNTIGRLNKIDFELNFSPFHREENKKKENTKMPTLLKLFSFIRLQFYYNPIQKEPLITKCFDHFLGNKSFTYLEDLWFLNITEQKIETAKQNISKMNKHFSDKGIKLIFLIASDKYDVYRPFMKDYTLPVDTTTDELDKLPDVCVINTKYMLQKMVQDGEKDVYRINDSHWSYKASETVARQI